MASVVVIGSEALTKKLIELEGSLRGRVLARAAEAGAEPVRDMAGQLAPRRSGDLAGSMEKEVVLSELERADVAVGPTAYEGLFQELGTEHHEAQPFLRPALDGSEGDVISEVANVLRRDVLEVARGN